MALRRTMLGARWLILAAMACSRRSDSVETGRFSLPAASPVTRSVQIPNQEAKLPGALATDGLALRVVYPGPLDAVRVKDSSFMLGSVSSGDVRVSINREPVRVWPNGAWLAWLPFPPDSIMEFRIVARQGPDSVVLHHMVRRDRQFFPREVRSGSVWLDSVSLSPQGQVWLPKNEYLTLSVRGAEGARVRALLPDGSVVRLLPQKQPEEVLPGIRAFELDTAKLRTPDEIRYVGVVRGRTVGPDPGPVLQRSSVTVATNLARAALRCVIRAPCPVPYSRLMAPAGDWMLVEAARDGDTVRVRWPLQVALLDTMPVVAEFDDDTTGQAMTDSLVPGRPAPGGPYHWFFLTGTRGTVTGRLNDEARVRLSSDAEAWVSVAETRALPRGLPAARAVAGSATMTAMRDRVALRIPLTQRVPFHITEHERGLSLVIYGAVADVDWLRYGSDSLVRRLGWTQTSVDELTFTVELAQPVWGYRARWSRNDLVLEVRRPPAIRRGDPLTGRVVALDPGHPPLGATGPTGLREAEANLGVALRLRAMLEEAGAKVVLTRTVDTAVELWPRQALAESSGAELLVSIHNNALPDGVNPFTNNGTSVFYYHPRSLPLAAALHRALVRRLKLRDLGVGRGDLSILRGTWMPAALSEGMFLIMPEQELLLRSAAGQRRYAAGVFEGIRQFLAERASTRPGARVGPPVSGTSPRANPSTSLPPPASGGVESGVAP